MSAQQHGASNTRMRRALWALITGLALAALAASAGAENAWIKDELRLNLRTGPGTQYRIMGAVKTGDAAQVLERGDGWTKVRVAELGEGWIPEGYLQPEPPAGVRLARSEAQTAEFRDQFESLTTRTEELEKQNREISERDAEQRKAIERLGRENFELRAGARWPEWITGAGILAAGMALGALLHTISARRARPRLRL